MKKNFYKSSEIFDLCLKNCGANGNFKYILNDNSFRVIVKKPWRQDSYNYLPQAIFLFFQLHRIFRICILLFNLFLKTNICKHSKGMILEGKPLVAIAPAPLLLKVLASQQILYWPITCSLS